MKEEDVQTIIETEKGSEEITYTLEEVRAAFMELSKTKGKNTAKEVLKTFGVSKINDIPDEKYSEVMKAVKEA